MLRSSLLVALWAVAAGLLATESTMIGWRHDGTGHFPSDCKPPRQWNAASGENIAWRCPLPNHGNSSPIAVGKKVFVICEPGYPAGVDAPLLLCIDGDSGSVLWQRQVDPFDKLPGPQAEVAKRLRAEYWEKLRLAGTLHAQWQRAEGADKEALQAKAVEAFGIGFSEKKGFSGVTDMPFGDKRQRQHWAPLVKKLEFQVPAWRWTGMGPSMTPLVSDGKRVYVVNGFKFVAAYDLDGNQVWMNYHHDIPYRHHWVESSGNAPLFVDGKLIAFFLDRLVSYEPETGAVNWMIETREFDGHGMGTPVVLRLPVAGSDETVTAVFAQSGELVRVSDGHVYATDIGFFDSCACMTTDGKNVLFAHNGGSGGSWRGPKMGQGRRFMDPGSVAIRFTLKDRDTLAAEQVWNQPKVSLGSVPLYADGKLYTRKGIFDAAAGKLISHKNISLNYYNGMILADGLLIGNEQGGPPKKSGQKTSPFQTRVYPLDKLQEKSWEPMVNALEMVPDLEGSEEHKAKVTAMTGSLSYRQWYGWHNSYSTPFASGNRLFIRTYDYLWCIGDKSQPFVPSTAFMPR